jgi:hypothetical protein
MVGTGLTRLPLPCPWLQSLQEAVKITHEERFLVARV